MRRLLLLVVLLATQPYSTEASASDLESLEQQAFNEAVSAVADSVVQIRTVGGLDRVGKTLISGGPTTGVIISADGYIVSSAFNFAGKPTSILVKLADGEQLAAELVGRDTNRMLVLLKVSTERALPVPKALNAADIRAGQWAIAVGRTFQTDRTDVSVGVVSALRRMYGRVLQTDANISVANYGGPLVDIAGNVLGILVPMSPQPSSGENAELAGAEFYDSGIGFAVPMDHVLGILERWKAQPELLPGKLGIGLQSGDAHVTPPKITSVWRESPAAIAGWQANDLITAVNGTAVATQAQLRFQITPLYADDTVRVTLERDGAEIQTDVRLTGVLAPYRHAFLGTLPESTPQDENPNGVRIRLVWPNSPADAAGLESGDKITKLDDEKVATRADLQKQLLAMHPKQTITVTVKRGDETIEVEAVLTTIPDELLSVADLANYFSKPQPETANQAVQDKLTVPEFEQEAKFFAPALAEGERPGLLLWLGDGNAENNQAIVDEWQTVCERDKLVLLIAPPKQDASWATDDVAYLQQLIRLAVRRFSVERHRLVVLGEGKAGQLAYSLALTSRSGFGGVVSIDAPLPRSLKPRAASPNNRLAVLILESQDAGFAPLIRRDVETLRTAGYPTIKVTQPAGAADQPGLSAAARSSIARWIIGLDRL